MNFKPVSILGSERGSALIVTVMILFAVTVLGILATRSATIELQVASHDKTHKMTWYATDAVCDGLAPELLEQNIENRGFGDKPAPFPFGPSGGLDVHESQFYKNEICQIPSETNRDIQVSGLSDTTVYVSIFGDTRFNPGNAIQLPEGYHGRGKGMAGGGIQLVYTIRGLGRGAANSTARITTGWRHVI